MCDFFWKRMENHQDQGDLADIVRASGGGGGGGISSDLYISDWQLPSDHMNFPLPATDDFGDPFANFRDPLLHELAAAPTFFSSPAVAASGGGVGDLGQKTLSIGDDHQAKRPNLHTFSRMLQISPGGAVKQPPLSPRPIRPSPIVTGPAACSIDSSSPAAQISSPRSTGIKRRKNHAKKVVCIPAPAAASSRATGEVVPSDLWAWRKYGQKPIKGSPYPRGYYRCSSSKGCSARKQVERSRTDPNMLVITYTSEHNHPWPTQRNALAGSTRSSQPLKNATASSSSSSSIKNNPSLGQTSSTISPKEGEPEKEHPPPETQVKQEFGDVDKSTDADHQRQDGGDRFADSMLHQNYRPMIPDVGCGGAAGGQSDDEFFADLAELEPNPMSLIFSRGMIGEVKMDDSMMKEINNNNNKSLDPLFFDWSSSSSTFGKTQ